MRKFLVFILLISSLSGCQTTGDERHIRYPAQLTGIGDSPNYPLRAAGFDRAEIMTYSPGMTNISFAYNYNTFSAQIASTIYSYKKTDDNVVIEEQFRKEKSNIEKYHPDAELLLEEDQVFNKEGKEYKALVAQYQFSGVFMNKQQVLYSELILIDTGSNFVKLRSTAPISQRLIAIEKNTELMNVINWRN